MRILITGGRGALGQALVGALADEHETIPHDIEEMDITVPAVVDAEFRAIRPEMVIHTAAYTDVDGCARDPTLAYRVNALGSQNIALACSAHDVPLVHLSTNEVFAGDDPAGYQEWRPPAPINPYGESKAAAEFFVRAISRRHFIVRTAWLYAPGGRNFIHAILSRARSMGALRVVADEIGNPTYAADLAAAITCLIATGRYGTYHLVNEGSCSRWAFANEILSLAGLGHVANEPILSKQFRRASTPPPYGALLNVAGTALGIRLRPWQDALADYMSDHKPDGLS